MIGEKIEELAYYFSVAAHQAVQQKRKYTNEPYYRHPYEVAQIVKGVGGTPSMVAAAYLHDCVEDTGVDQWTIDRMFGAHIGDLVAGLTDVSKPEHGNRTARKQIDREHTALQSPECKTIKLADLISNSRSIVKHDKDFARVYIKEKELLLEVLTEGDATLYSQAKQIVEEAKKELGIN